MIVDDGLVLVFDSVLTDELLLEGDVRDLVRAIQDARKQADYDIADRISLSLSGSQDYIDKLTEQFGEYLQHETLSVLVEDIYDTDIQ
jgi:isoleucyl-tRNA synthetase